MGSGAFLSLYLKLGRIKSTAVAEHPGTHPQQWRTSLTGMHWDCRFQTLRPLLHIKHRHTTTNEVHSVSYSVELKEVGMPSLHWQCFRTGTDTPLALGL